MSAHLRIFNLTHERPWVITATELDRIIAILEHHEQAEAAIDALAAKQGRPLEYTSQPVELREGGTAVIAVEGPLFKRANLLTEHSGATSIRLLAKDFQAALENPQVERILLNIDSPGGEVDGINEFADRVQASPKPVIAYVDGLAASGAYWIAAAAHRIVTSEGAMLGSIGAVASILDRRGAQERQGVRSYDIVSSQSPYKRPDPATDAGRMQIQKLVDAAAELFIRKVAAFRGITPEKVMADYGGGATVPASDAIAAGMADTIGDYEDLISQLADRGSSRSLQIRAGERSGFERQRVSALLAESHELLDSAQRQISLSGGNPMADKPEQNPTPPVKPPVTPNPPPNPPPSPPEPPPKKSAVEEERTRIRAILAHSEAEGREALARHLALETAMSTEEAAALLAVAPKQVPAMLAAPNPLAQAMATVTNPKVGIQTSEDEDSADAEAAKVLAHVHPSRRLKAVN